MIPYYQDEAVTIYHGDCREILPSLPKVDLVLTDPPYGIDIVSSNGTIGGTSRNIKQRQADINSVHAPVVGDDRPTDALYLVGLARQAIIWGGNYIANQLPPSPCWLVWYKRINGQCNNFADCELAWTSLDKPSRVIQHLWMGMIRDSEHEEHYHPTQKPVALMQWAIQQADDVRTVIDPFMGAGPVIRAAKNLSMKAIGIEIEERYCEVAVNRCRQMVMELGI